MTNTQISVAGFPAAGGRTRFAAAGVLAALAVLGCGEALAVDITFNIKYIGEAESPVGGGYGDVWAEGGYAYVGSDINGGGLAIFSLDNPINPGIPVYLTTYPGDQFEDVEVYDGIAYVGSDVTTSSSGTGVDIVDVSIPFDPLFMSRVNGFDCLSPGVCAHNKVHTLSVSKTDDNRTFLYTADNATDVVKITNVTDPYNPQLVASLDMGLGPTQTTDIASHEVVVRNNRLYVASKDNGFNNCCGWTNIYDVSEPASPVLLKKFESGPRSHTATPSEDGNLLVVSEERPNGNVHIYDISMIDSPNDPDDPILLSTLNRTNVGIEAHSPHHPHLHGNLLFLTWYEAGLQVFNLTDPSNPVHVGSFDTYPGTSSSYRGNWGVDMFLGLGNVLLSDRQRGLIVVDARGVIDAGDYDLDMSVDGDDYIAWWSTFGDTDSGQHVAPLADGNGNGVVDAADYVLWRKVVSGLGAGAGANVPEPSAFAILASVALVLPRRRAALARLTQPGHLGQA